MKYKKVYIAAILTAFCLTSCADSSGSASTGTDGVQNTVSDEEQTGGTESETDDEQSGPDGTDSDIETTTSPEETETSATVPQTEEEWIAKGREISCRMAEGDFETAEEVFSKAIASQLDAAGLGEIYLQAIDSLGEYMRCYGSEAVMTEAGYQIDTILEYEETGLVVKLQFAGADTVILEKIQFDYSGLPKEYVRTDEFEESPITVGEGEFVLDGILTVPTNPQDDMPIAILIADMGKHDMNETVGAAGNTPFRDIAWNLAAQGIASIRYNNRLYQYEDSIDKRTLTIEEEVLEDVGYAVELAEDYSDNIYLIGHGLGAMLAPNIAEDYAEVSGIVMLAGSPRSVAELTKDRILKEYEMSGLFEKEDLDMYEDQYGLTVQKVLGYTERDASKFDMEAYGTYWASINALALPQAAEDTSLPLLILQGNVDYQVPISDYQSWQELLGKKDNVTFEMFGGLNHFFLPTRGKSNPDDYDAEGEVPTQVTDVISRWISNR